jgi:hypothetical protein
VNRYKLCVALLALAALIVTPASGIVNFINKVSIAEGNPIPPPVPWVVAEGNPIPPPVPWVVAEGNPIPPPVPWVVAEGSPMPPPAPPVAVFIV